jgi:poly-beta-1,6-N-acetyl-D-glucosamine synthase
VSPLASGWQLLDRETARTIEMLQIVQQPGSYVLVTAAYNEGKLIENTIRSVISQNCLPAKWVIVSDASTDDTDAIVTRYAAENRFIQLHRIRDDHPRNFAAQAHAINAGIAQLAAEDFDFIGNLDADITLAPSYFEQLLKKFHEDPQLGLGGGLICERCEDGVFRSRRDNSVTSVAHAVQLFRRACFQAVGGGYVPLPYGAPDTYAEVTARMRGWRVSSFPDLEALHHRATGSAGGMLRGCFRQGRMDHSLGTLPLFEVCKVLRRVNVNPRVLGAASRLAGFIFAYYRSETRPVSDEFVTYFRQEQRARLLNLFRSKSKQPPHAPFTTQAHSSDRELQ